MRHENMIGKLAARFTHFNNPTYTDYLIHPSWLRLPTPPVDYLLWLILEPASSSMTLHLYPRSCVIIRSKVIALSSLRFSSSLLLFHLNKSSSSINNPIKAIWNWGGREVGPVLTQTMTTPMWKGGRSHPKPKLGYPKRAFQHRYIDKKQEWPGVRSRNIASLPPPWPCIYIQDHASSFMSVCPRCIIQI